MGGASRALPKHYTAAKAKKFSKRKPIVIHGRTVRAVLLACALLFAFGLYLLWSFSGGRVSSSDSLLLSTPRTNSGLERAAVDISMQDLYNRITFEDIDGGAWKQGWDVQYRGDEWDETKLRIFVVPHSHNDPGWLRTVEQYYQEKSRSIINTIIGALRKV